MSHFNVLVGKVMDFLDENNYNSCTRRGIKSCFRLLGRHLEQSGNEYTPEAADEWFRLIEPDTSATYARFYRSALIKLCDMHETGGRFFMHEAQRRPERLYPGLIPFGCQQVLHLSLWIRDTFFQRYNF